jgi:hypothetical protein
MPFKPFKGSFQPGIFHAKPVDLPHHQAESAGEQFAKNRHNTIILSYASTPHEPATVELAHPINARRKIEQFQLNGYNFSPVEHVTRHRDEAPPKPGRYISFEPLVADTSTYPQIEDFEIAPKTYLRDMPYIVREALVSPDGEVHTKAEFCPSVHTAINRVRDYNARYGKEGLVVSPENVRWAVVEEIRQRELKQGKGPTLDAEPEPDHAHSR